MALHVSEGQPTPIVTTPQSPWTTSRAPFVGGINPIQTTTNIYDTRAISDLNMLSPPITPVRQPLTNKSSGPSPLPPTPRSSLEERPAAHWTVTVPRIYGAKYSVGKRIGSGAWSDVFIAEESRQVPQNTEMGTLTPPPSPNMSSQGRLLAVKVPNQRNARRVLAREAKVLTFVSADAAARSHIIGFHGQDAETGAIVMDLGSQTLSSFVHRRQRDMLLSTSTMFDPVIGETTWKALARQLISSIEWLHGRGVVHGDIKADNLLLRPSMRLSDQGLGNDPHLEAVLCDFSSALVDDEELTEREAADDAITTAYASPELLASFRFMTGKFEKPVDRRKADIWAAAVCLAFAATGSEPYAEARSGIQKSALAKHGDILGSLRRSDQATRIMKGGFVAKTVAPALCLDPVQRVSANEWIQRLPF